MPVIGRLPALQLPRQSARRPLTRDPLFIASLAISIIGALACVVFVVASL